MDETFTAFEGVRRLAAGPLSAVALAVKHAAETAAPIVIFSDRSGRPIDLDLRGSEADVAARVSVQPKAGAESETAEVAGRASGPGRPRLGVVSREVSLLPRHWDWLKTQRGGASAALRRLVDEARRNGGTRDRFVAAQDAVDRYLRVMAGDRPHYEDALRAFYAGRQEDLVTHAANWPADIRAHLEVLLQRCRESQAT
jgi:hypothetical protein